MSLFDDIQKKYLEARKNQDKFLSVVLGMLVSDLKYEKINKQKELEDADVISVIQKSIKQKKEALEEFKKADRKDLIDNATKEIEVLLSFLPSMLSEEELVNLVKSTIAELNASSMKDLGRVMKEVMQKAKGRADGAKVKEITTSLLQG
jgi:hypothetical protein